MIRQASQIPLSALSLILLVERRKCACGSMHTMPARTLRIELRTSLGIETREASCDLLAALSYLPRIKQYIDTECRICDDCFQAGPARRRLHKPLYLQDGDEGLRLLTEPPKIPERKLRPTKPKITLTTIMRDLR